MATRTTRLLASALGLSAVLSAGLAACGGDSSTIGIASGDGGSEGSVTTEGGSGSDSGGGGVDSGSSDDGSMSTDAGDMTDSGDAGQCNMLKAPAVDVAVTYGGEPPPDPQGGVIAPGTYKLSQVVLYGAMLDSGVPDAGATSILERGEIVLGVTTYDTVTVVSAGGAAMTRRDGSGTYAVSVGGKAIDFTETCPKAATPKAGYTALGTTITIYRPETILGKDYIAGMTYGP